jgi:DNA-3-methyladenine glycosylase
MHSKLHQSFFIRDVLEVAPDLPGMKIVRTIDGQRFEWIVTEVEAYRGIEDLACHARRGRTKRTEIMYHGGGHIYIYLIYGMYWMLNIVTGPEDNPQAVLIRSLKGVQGPGRVSRELRLDESFYGERVFDSGRIWIEEGIKPESVQTGSRIGIEYAGEYWSKIKWRYFIDL